MDRVLKVFFIFLIINSSQCSIFENELDMQQENILQEDLDYNWKTYHKLSEINRYLKAMSQKYSDVAQLVKGGESYEGRDILGIRISNPSKKNKTTLMIESGIHALEWTGPASITYFINQLLTSNNPDLQKLRNEYEWHIFPVVNPDGYYYTVFVDFFWRKTRTDPPPYSLCYGADANRNWDYHWGQHLNASNDPCSDRFFGQKVFSELETRTLSQYIAKLKKQNLVAYLAFHADAQCLLIPYSDSSDHVENYDDLVKIGKTAIKYGYKVNSTKYDGPATAKDLLYATSGTSMDWVKHALKVPLTYTFELQHWPQDGIFPANELPVQGDEVTQMILGLVKEGKKLGYF